MASNTFKYKNYHGSCDASLEDNVLHGRILFVNDLVTYEAETVPLLKAAFEEAVDDYLETCKLVGKVPDQSYSGSFNVRIPAEDHRKVALIAHERFGGKINQVVCAAIKQFITGGVLLEHNHTIHHHFSVRTWVGHKQVEIDKNKTGEIDRWPVEFIDTPGDSNNGVHH